jgi:sugar phosphate isomerase/epimerase
MKFCISTWNYLANYGVETDLFSAAEEIRNIGFGIELFLNWPADLAIFHRNNWSTIKERCGNPEGLSLHSGVVRSFSEEAIREEIDLCRYLEADLLVLHPRSLGVEEGTLDLYPSAQLDDADLHRIIAIVEYARDRGVVLALENGTLEVLQRVRDHVKVELGTDNFGICIDTGHANLHREQDASYLLRLIEEFRDELIQVHLSDNAGETDEHNLPGRGNIEWPGVISDLKVMDFTGPFVLELRTPDPPESAKTAREFVLDLYGIGKQ